MTGFHKRKVERRKVAVEEIKCKLKEEQKKMKEEVLRPFVDTSGNNQSAGASNMFQCNFPIYLVAF